MKTIKTILFPVAIGMLAIAMYSCKAKKVVAKPNPPETVTEAAPVEEKKPEPAPVEEKAPAPVEKPNFDFSNVQFEFNSSVLKTTSYTILDKVAAEMKKDPSAKFIVNGHSSAEGTAEHNMSLSVDRANSVKSYLVNAGLNASNFAIKGYGESQPISSNDTEEGKQLNRRVEIKAN